MKRWLLPIAMALSLAGCGAMVGDTKAAETGVVSFHQAMDAGQYAMIYDASGPEMKSSMPRDDFMKLLTAMHDKLGVFRSGKTINWNVNYGTGGHMVTLHREAQFEKGVGTEEFVFRVAGDKATLVGWHVMSNALVTG